MSKPKITKKEAKQMQAEIDKRRCREGRCNGCEYCPKEPEA